MSGIALIISTLTYIETKTIERDIASIELDQRIDIVTQKLDETLQHIAVAQQKLVEKLQRIDKMQQKIDKTSQTKYRTKEEAAYLVELNSMINELIEMHPKTERQIEEYNRLAQEQEIKLIKIYHEKRKNVVQTKKIKMFKHLSFFIYPMGSLLTILGMIFWYRRIQYPQDKTLKNDLEEKNKEKEKGTV